MIIDKIDILVVEDNPGDVALMRAGFEGAARATRLHVVGDGDEAMDFLNRRGLHPEAPHPDLIVLDLNLPRKDGLQVLSELKASIELRTIPVLVFSSSAAEQDVNASYGLQANCFITKPLDFAGFERVVRQIDSFWLSVVELPTSEFSDAGAAV